MSFQTLKGIKGFCALAVLLAATVPIIAQNNRNDNVRTDDTRPARTETPRVVTQEDDTDWGWLGLLGLLGLAGLLPKKRSIEVRGVRDQNANPTTSTTGTTH